MLPGSLSPVSAFLGIAYFDVADSCPDISIDDRQYPTPQQMLPLIIGGVYVPTHAGLCRDNVRRLVPIG